MIKIGVVTAFVLLFTGCGGGRNGGEAVDDRKDDAAPTVVATEPAADAVEIDPTGLSVQFSEAMDPASLGPATFTLTGPEGDVRGNITYSNLTATFTPDTALYYNATYTATLSAAVTDSSGAPLAAPYRWSFATPAAPRLDTGYALKTLRFNWPRVFGATAYRLLEQTEVDGAFAPLVDLLADLPADITDYAHRVSLHTRDWSRTHYRLDACTTTGCSPSAQLDLYPGINTAIGFITAAQPEANSRFGGAVALSADGHTMAVAAAGTASDTGAVYLYQHAAGGWQHEFTLHAANADPGDRYGAALALSADGQTLAVGAPGEASTGVAPADNNAPGAGAVYIYSNNESGWTERAYIKASNADANDGFGSSVAIGTAGTLIAVGAPGEDSAARGVDGDQADNNAEDTGAVYVYRLDAGDWRQAAYVKASNTQAPNEGTSINQFGTRIALNADGTLLAVGAPGESGMSRTINGDQDNFGRHFSGAVYVFTNSNTTWRQEAYIKASNAGWGDLFGHALVLNADGNTLAVGAISEDSGASGVGGLQDNEGARAAGAVYVFTRADGVWTQQAYVKPTNTAADCGFGNALAMNSGGDMLAVGAAGEDSSATGIGGDQADRGATSSGAVYIYSIIDGAWSPLNYVKASNTQADDHFGIAVALSGDGHTLAVGADGRDGTAVGGGPGKSGVAETGAVYLY